MRRRELDRKAVARKARGSMGTVVRRGVMAACARVNGAEEWPGGTDSAARPSESVADGMEEADVLASASNLALSARR
eukprot:2386191-Pleurochrysis_carterae.AAC.1